MLVLLRCTWLFFFFSWVLNRTASPVAAGCGCNEHGSLAAANRSFSYLPARKRWKLVAKIQASQSFWKTLPATRASGEVAFPHTHVHTRAPCAVPKSLRSTKARGLALGPGAGRCTGCSAPCLWRTAGKICGFPVAGVLLSPGRVEMAPGGKELLRSSSQPAPALSPHPLGQGTAHSQLRVFSASQG